MSRKEARDKLFKMIFETLFLQMENAKQFEEFLKTDECTEDNFNFVKENFSLFVEHREKVAAIVEANVEKYKVERLFRVDYAILLMAVNEIENYKLTPVEVVINEAVELAKKYSTPKSHSFINGVLAKIVK